MSKQLRLKKYFYIDVPSTQKGTSYSILLHLLRHRLSLSEILWTGLCVAEDIDLNSESKKSNQTQEVMHIKCTLNIHPSIKTDDSMDMNLSWSFRKPSSLMKATLYDSLPSLKPAELWAYFCAGVDVFGGVDKVCEILEIDKAHFQNARNVSDSQVTIPTEEVRHTGVEDTKTEHAVVTQPTPSVSIEPAHVNENSRAIGIHPSDSELNQADLSINGSTFATENHVQQNVSSNDPGSAVLNESSDALTAQSDKPYINSENTQNTSNISGNIECNEYTEQRPEQRPSANSLDFLKGKFEV